MFTFGLPFISRFATFLASLGGSQKPIEIFDKTPPAPPRISSLPESTNNSSLQVSGNAEAGSVVKISFNNSVKEVVADVNGNFSANFTLKQGENLVFATAGDKSGNVSSESKNFKVVYDDTPPKIEITKPNDGQSFYGSGQQELEVQGKVEPGVNLNINDRFTSPSEEGLFTQRIKLSEGENTIKVVAIDQAGNKSEKSLSVKFYPY